MGPVPHIRCDSARVGYLRRRGTGANLATRGLRGLPVAMFVLSFWTMTGPLVAQQGITLQLASASQGGRAYTARLTAVGESRIRVEIRIDEITRDSHTPAGDFPAFIQRGGCGDPTASRAYQLSNVREGYSLTELDVSVSELTAAVHAIVIDPGPEERTGRYLACGALPVSAEALPGAGAAPPEAGSPPGPYGVGLVQAAVVLLVAAAISGGVLIVRRQR